MTDKANIRERQQQQVDANYETFLQLNDEVFLQNYGRHALMRDGEVVEVFDSWQDARKTAMLLYEDKVFLVQKFDKTPVDLGFYSYAVH